MLVTLSASERDKGKQHQLPRKLSDRDLSVQSPVVNTDSQSQNEYIFKKMIKKHKLTNDMEEKQMSLLK